MDSVTTSRDAAKARYDDLRKTRLEEFMTGFSAISSKLKEMYQVSHRVSIGDVMFADLGLTIDDNIGGQRGARARG